MIGIVVVVYKSYENVLRYVHKELSKVVIPHCTVIVDVGSPRSSAERIASALGISVSENDSCVGGPLCLLHSEENLGYARGNNLGAEFLMRNFPAVDKLLFSNDDIEFITPNTVELLADKLDALPDAGCIGPRIVGQDGEQQGPATGIPSIAKTIKTNFILPICGQKIIDKNREPLKTDAGAVRRVEGCFMMTQANVFVQAGCFDPRTFLYWEEEIFSCRLDAIGKRVYFCPDANILHYKGYTTGAHATSLQLVKTELRGQRIYFCNYSRANFFERTLLGLSACFRLALVSAASFRRWILRKH